MTADDNTAFSLVEISEHLGLVVNFHSLQRTNKLVKVKTKEIYNNK